MIMKQTTCTIQANEPIATSVWRMRLFGDTSNILPGQFVNIRVDGQFLRRPISVCDVQENVLTIIYKVVGVGTQTMSMMPIGYTVDILTGLGNGYHISNAGHAPVLIGGGVGVPPMYMLARTLRQKNINVKVVLGFNTKNEVFYEQDFRALGCDVIVTTVDGSYGVKGFVTDALDGQQTYYYTCGPLPMIKAVMNALGTHGEVSMEERMGCGFGACMGCTIQTTKGPKRVCKEGPVFAANELLLLE